MKKKHVIIVVLALAIIAIIVSMNMTSKETEQQIKVPVEIEDFEITVKTTGELQAENSENILGPSSLRKIGIWRIKITDLVPEGTLVDSGDYVAELDKNEIVRKLDEVSEQLQKVQTQYQRTKLDTALELRQLRDQLINLKYSEEEAEIEVDESAFESPATKRQANIRLDKAKRAFNQALENYDLKVDKNKASMQEVSISLNQQQRRLNDIKEVMGEFTIYAPKPGMVIYKKEWNGQKRKVGSEIDPWNPTVATLPDMSTMISRTYVNEIDISKLSKGQDVTVEVDAFPGKKYTGVIEEVANVGEDLPRNDAKVFEVLIKIFESDTILRPNMTSSNTVHVAYMKDVLQVPLEAIRNNDSLSYVIKESGFSKVRQIVELGVSNENKIEIKQGLNQSEIVYLSTPSDIDDLEFKGLNIYKEILEKRKILKEEMEEKRRLEKERMEKEKSDSSNSMEKFQQLQKGKNFSFKKGNK